MTDSAAQRGFGLKTTPSLTQRRSVERQESLGAGTASPALSSTRSTEVKVPPSPGSRNKSVRIHDHHISVNDVEMRPIHQESTTLSSPRLRNSQDMHGALQADTSHDTVKVKVHEAKFISSLFTSQSRPQVTLICGDQRYESKIATDTKCVTWTEEFAFDIDSNSRELFVTVIDKSKEMPRDVLGKAFIVVEKKSTEKWYALGLKGTRSGEIRLEMIFNNEPLTEKASPAPGKLAAPTKVVSEDDDNEAIGEADKEARQLSELELLYSSLPRVGVDDHRIPVRHSIPPTGTGSITVHIIEARGLPPMDIDGYCDPFVVVRVGDQTRRASIKKKTLNPKWYESFQFEQVTSQDDIFMEVIDWDFVSENDLVGTLRIPVVKLCDKDEGWFQLIDRDRENPFRGSIFLRFDIA